MQSSKWWHCTYLADALRKMVAVYSIKQWRQCCTHLAGALKQNGGSALNQTMDNGSSAALIWLIYSR